MLYWQPILEVIDVNNDGKEDVITNNGRYFLQQSGGTFSKALYYRSTSEFVEGMTAGDFNNDGHTDIFDVMTDFHNVYLWKPFGLDEGSLSLTGQYFQRTNSDSQTALLIQNAAGQDIFTVDTLSPSIKIAAAVNNNQTLNIKNSSGATVFNIDTSNGQATVGQNNSTNTLPSKFVSGLEGRWYNSDSTNYQTVGAGTLAFAGTDGPINWTNIATTRPSGVNSTYINARWTGYIRPSFSETYTFYTSSGDGSRLYINGNLVVDNWYVQNTTERSGTITLTAGQWYAITIDYFQATGSAAMTASWSSTSQPKQLIPLASMGSSGQGIAALVTNGASVVQTSTNSKYALDIQNNVGSSIFVTDTTPDNSILRNKSFENADLTATAWTGTTGATITYDTTQQFIGYSSAKAVTTATANAGLKYTTGNAAPYNLATSSTYTLSWYARLDAASAAFTDMIAAYARDGATETNCTGMNTQTVVSNGWTRFSCTITTPAAAPTAAAYIVIKQTAATAHTFYIDAVQIELGATGTAFREGAVSLNGVVTSPTSFKNQSNSSTAFMVQNASGGTLLSVDTLNSQLTVTSTTNNTAAFRVVNATGTAVLTVDTSNNRLELASAVDLKFAGSGNARNAILKDFTCSATEAVNDIVIVTAAGTVGRTTTAASNRVAGVVVAKPATTTCTTAIGGVVQVLFGANATPTTIGDPVETSATAGAARATTTPVAGGVLGQSMSNKDGSNLVWVLLRAN